MNSKLFYRSKTVWFNALTIITAVAAYFGWNLDQQITMNVAGFLVAREPDHQLGPPPHDQEADRSRHRSSRLVP